MVTLLATLLPLIGVQVGSEALTQTLETIIVVVSGIVIWVERVRRGDVTPIGIRK